MWTNETGNRPRFEGSLKRWPSIQFSSSVSSLTITMVSPSSKVSSSSLSASQSYKARQRRSRVKSLLWIKKLMKFFPGISLQCVVTFLGGGTGFLYDLDDRSLRPPEIWRTACWWPPDSSENESRLSVDRPLRIRDVMGGEGETRFSGEDSSAKLCMCIGGDVSELPLDFDPTKMYKNDSVKRYFSFHHFLQTHREGKPCDDPVLIHCWSGKKILGYSIRYRCPLTGIFYE